MRFRKKSDTKLQATFLGARFDWTTEEVQAVEDLIKKIELVAWSVHRLSDKSGFSKELIAALEDAGYSQK